MRRVAQIIAMLMVATVGPLALAGTANASGGAELVPAAQSTSASADRAKPKHVVRFLQSGETRRDGVFYVRGRLTEAPGKAVYLQVKTARNPKLRTVTGERSSRSNGRFGITWRGKCGAAYYITIRESPSFARTAIRVGKVRCY